MSAVYTFERTELRVLQATYDNEEFLTVVAMLIGKLTQERNAYKLQAELAEDTIRELMNLGG